jgi:hypothetical protein
MICDDISEFESSHPSHAVGLSQVRSPAIVMDIAADERDELPPPHVGMAPAWQEKM